MLKKLKYTTLLDYLLYILSLAKSSGLRYVSLVSLVESLKYEASFSDIQEIGKYLDTMGWAKVFFSLGDVKAQITSRGMVYVEEKPEEFEKEAASYIESLAKKTLEDFIIHVSSVPVDPQKTIFKIIDASIGKIKKYQGEHSDFLIDLEVVKIELTKSLPDFQLIEIKLNKLSALEYISSEVQELKDYLLVPAN